MPQLSLATTTTDTSPDPAHRTTRMEAHQQRANSTVLQSPSTSPPRLLSRKESHKPERPLALPPITKTTKANITRGQLLRHNLSTPTEEDKYDLSTPIPIYWEDEGIIPCSCPAFTATYSYTDPRALPLRQYGRNSYYVRSPQDFTIPAGGTAYFTPGLAIHVPPGFIAMVSPNATKADGLERFVVTSSSFHVHQGEPRIAIYLGNPERVLPCLVKRGENIGLLQLTINKDPEDDIDWNPDTPGARNQTASPWEPTHENGCPLRKLARQWGIHEEIPSRHTEPQSA